MNISLRQKAFALEWTTLLWNIVGTVVLGITAFRAHSIALGSFGLDSLIEIGASAVVLWELSESGIVRQKKGLKIIAVAFCLLALYVGTQSTVILLLSFHPGYSIPGMAWVGITACVMFSLALSKALVGKALANPLVSAEGRVTFIDGVLATTVLLGLLGNFWGGWWWADPVAGYIVVFYAVREAVSIFKG